MADLAISLLELFEGRVSLSEMFVTPLNFLYSLRDSKIELVREKQKVQAEYERKAKEAAEANRKSSPARRHR